DQRVVEVGAAQMLARDIAVAGRLAGVLRRIGQARRHASGGVRIAGIIVAATAVEYVGARAALEHVVVVVAAQLVVEPTAAQVLDAGIGIADGVAGVVGR